jgi:FkbM family methyltransferase
MSLPDRAWVFLLRNAWQLSKSTNIAVRIQGDDEASLVIPLVGRLGFQLLDPVDSDLLETLKKVLQHRRGPVVDVGANIGLLLRGLAQIDREIPYVAFEPSVTCCHYLEAFIRSNGLTRHVVFPVALGCEGGVVTFQFNEEADVSGTITRGFRPQAMYRHRKPVILESGDAILSEVFRDSCDRIALVKMDVEGAESLVLNGLTQTIATHRPFIILEIAPYQHFIDGTLNKAYFGEVTQSEAERIARWRQERIRDIDSFLEDRRYACLKILKNGDLRRVSSVDQGSQKDFKELNYLAVPHEEFARFVDAFGTASEAAP